MCVRVCVCVCAFIWGNVGNFTTNARNIYSRLKRYKITKKNPLSSSRVTGAFFTNRSVKPGPHQQQSNTVAYTGNFVACDKMLLLRCCFVAICRNNWIYSVSQKSSPLKLFAIFSLLVNLCNWKLSRLLPNHIPMCIPILVHLSKYLCKLYHFF